MRLPSLHFREGCLDLLLKAGADKEVICRFRRTALHYAMEAAANGKETCVDLLLKAGANREAKDTYGQTALDLATTEAIKALLRVRRMPPPPQQNNGSGGRVERGNVDTPVKRSLHKPKSLLSLELPSTHRFRGIPYSLM